MKTRYDQMRSGANITPEDATAINHINGRIIGYSNERHYAFFKTLFGVEDIKRVLILGVYHGRDIAYMLDVLARYHPGRQVEIVGVDKFTNDACDDWPADRKALNWAQAGFGTPPSLEGAILNVGAAPVKLHKAHDSDYLELTEEKFDVVYLDTAHDEKTVSRQLSQVRRVCNPEAILCGDDYSNEGTWGVKKAVEQSFTIHHIFADWIWFSSVEKLNPSSQ